jgi:uncharacterized membrane protein YkoI
MILVAIHRPYMQMGMMQHMGMMHGSTAINNMTMGEMQGMAPMMQQNMGQMSSQTTTNGMNDNMSMFDVFKSAKNITGSVNIIKLANTALAQNLNTSLADAIHNAQQNVGGNQSTAVAAHLTMVNGYLVYRVVVLGNDGMIHFVLVDPGNGSILDTHSFTLQQVITMILVAIHRPYMQMGMMQHMGMMHGSPEMPNMESMMPQNNWNMADMTMPTK